LPPWRRLSVGSSGSRDLGRFAPRRWERSILVRGEGNGRFSGHPARLRQGFSAASR
jgi:hypothetical protein